MLLSILGLYDVNSVRGRGHDLGQRSEQRFAVVDQMCIRDRLYCARWTVFHTFAAGDALCAVNLGRVGAAGEVRRVE